MKNLNAEVAYFAIDMVGKSAFDCANFINDHFSKVKASIASTWDTTKDSDSFGIYLDGNWLIVETK